MKYKIYSSLALGALISLASCSNEQLDSPGQADQNQPQYTYYTNLKLKMPEGTRAEESFVVGETAENSVNNILILFYDENEKFVGSMNSTNNTSTTVPNPDDVFNKVSWNEAKVVPINLFRPVGTTYAVALVNTPSTLDISDCTVEGKDFSDLEKKLAGLYNSTEGFLMTSSGKYDASGVYSILTDVSGYVYNTQEEAEASNSIDIYVERLAAKVQLDIEADAIKEYKVKDVNNNELSIAFSPKKWGVTGTESDSYLLKQSQTNSNAYGTAAGYDDNFSSWISYQNHRTFWAESPIYKQTTQDYPEVGGYDFQNTHSLKYVSYAAMDELTQEDGVYSGSQYIFEHTFPKSQWENATNLYAVPTSVVVYGGYEVKDDNDSKYEEGFYLRKIGDGTSSFTKIYTAEELETELESLQGILKIKEEGSQTAGKIGDYLTLSNRKVVDVNTNTTKSSNAFTLYLAELPVDGTTLSWWDSSSTSWKDVTEADLAAINVALRKNVGTAVFYNYGLGYYYLPIQHYNAGKYDGSLSGDEASGEFGIVRNHVYQVKISSIIGLANGRAGNPNNPGDPDDPEDPDDPDTPLPDPTPESQYWFDATVEVLGWHVITSTVEINDGSQN